MEDPFNTQTDILSLENTYIERSKKNGHFELECKLIKIFPEKINRGINKDNLMNIAVWKSPRIIHHIEENCDNEVSEISRAAFASEKYVRPIILTWLKGVQLPMASSILHFAYPDIYPIVDFRALRSVKSGFKGNDLTFSQWKEYVDFCQKLAGKYKVSMRTLDRALWKLDEIQNPTMRGARRG